MGNYRCLCRICGAALALVDLGDEQGGRTVPIWGDFLAFLGAVFVVGYIVSGRVLRKWMPIFLCYSSYSNRCITVDSHHILLRMILVQWALLDGFKQNISGGSWLLALIAGLLGHTGLNTLRTCRHLLFQPSVTMEPIIGSMIGFALFDRLPGFWTWLGGPILISGILMVILAVHRRIRTMKRLKFPMMHEGVNVNAENQGWLLLTNDDGIQAIGDTLLVEALNKRGHKVVVFAPSNNQSATWNAHQLDDSFILEI